VSGALDMLVQATGSGVLPLPLGHLLSFIKLIYQIFIASDSPLQVENMR
jgi:hypothetical protein